MSTENVSVHLKFYPLLNLFTQEDQIEFNIFYQFLINFHKCALKNLTVYWKIALYTALLRKISSGKSFQPVCSQLLSSKKRLCLSGTKYKISYIYLKTIYTQCMHTHMRTHVHTSPLISCSLLLISYLIPKEPCPQQTIKQPLLIYRE